jgi:hypothetical protein
VNGGDAAIEAYREQLAGELATIDMRAVPGFGKNGAPWGLELAATMVLPRLRGIRGEEAPQSVGQVLARHTAVVVHGEPGSGKTTLLGYLSLAYACRADEPIGRLAAGAAKDCPLPRDLVPMRVRLAGARFERDTAGEFSKLLRDQLDRFPAAVAEAVIQALTDGRGLLCVDGLDEIGDDADRRRVARALEAWTQRHGGRCWVTTRKHDALTLVDRFAPFELVPFGPDEIHEYLLRRRDPRANAWLQRSWDSPQLLALYRVPLLLVLALAIDGEEHRLPVDRVVLFERAIVMLVRDWNEERRPDALRRASGEVVDADEILRALAATALQMYEQRCLAQPVAREELHRLLAAELGGPSRADGALEVFVAKAGLLIAEGDRLRFWHPSFGEFLAAKALAAAARERPARLLRTASTSTGREVVRMAIAWLRTLGGDPRLASRLFEELLADVGGGPWARLFGVHVRLAVDVVREGHPLDEGEFSRMVARVLALVERAPVRANAELFAEMVAMRPEHVCPPALALRIVALVRRPALLPDHVVAASMRWLAAVAPGSAEVQACCEAELARRGDSHTWAAVGLLHAGIVRDAVVLAAVEPLAYRMGARQTPEVELARVLAPARGQVLPALQRLWAEHPPPTGPPPRDGGRDAAWHLHHALAALRALLVDDDAEVFAALFAEAQVHPYDGVVRAGLGWLVAHGDSARRKIGEALVDAEPVVADAAAELLRTMLLRDDQAEVASDVVIAALERGSDRLPSAALVLSVLPGDSASRQQHAVLGALRRLVASERGEFPHALARRWSRLADEAGPRWLLAALLWLSTQYVPEAEEVAAAADVLYAAVRGAELEVAVASACLLHERWDRLHPHTRRALLQAWIRGLHCPSVRDAAWRCLRRRMKEAEEDVRAALRATMDATDELVATIASLLLLGEPEVLPRARVVLWRSLASEDLAVVGMAFEGLQREPVVGEPELLERWFAAEIRLSLLGRRHPTIGVGPPSRALVELFLRSPWDPEATRFRLSVLERWLAGHTDALALAVAAFAGDAEPEPRAVGLLAACLDSPERVEALLVRVRGEGPATRAGAMTTIGHCCRLVGWNSPLHVALRSALHELLQDDLQSDDPAVLAKAVGILDRAHIFADIPAARGRLLELGNATSKRRVIRRWLEIQCPPEQREAFALQHFERGLAELAEALRTCLEDEPMAALEAGLLLRRIGGDGEPLRVRARAILAGPPGEPIEGEVRVEWLFEHERSHALRRALAGRSPRTWALLVLDDLGEDIGEAVLREVLGEPGTPAPWGRLEWLLEHRPEWAARAEPWIVGRIAETDVSEVIEVARRLCGPAAWSPSIVAALIRRWPEWIVTLLPAHDASLAAFIGQDVAPEPAQMAQWREQMQSPNPDLRERVALALAMTGRLDAALADVLIATALRWHSPAALRAEQYLGRPEDAAVFAARRRAHAADRGKTAEEAYEVLTLWSTSHERAVDRDVTLPLLRLAAGHAHTTMALSAAAWLAELDQAAGVAAAVEMVARSTEAAVWLLHRGEACLPAVERLWDTLEQPDMWTDWELALATLLPEQRGELRFAAALAKVATQANGWIAEKAIWLLAEVAPGRVPAVILDRLAETAGQARAAADWLYALSRGRRPGRRLDGAMDPSDPESQSLHIPIDDRRWSALGDTSTLAYKAELLIKLSPELRIDLEATAATLLGGDATRWSELWRRASARAVNPEEIDEIRAVVDVIDSDRPGQILARLIWRLRLAMTALLERDEDLPLAARPLSPPLSCTILPEMSQPAIVHFLIHRFSEGDLRRLVRYHYPALTALLPGTTASLREVADAWVRLLVEQGRLDHRFFDLLRAERDRFIATIDDLEQQTVDAQRIAPAPPAPTPTPAPTPAPAARKPTTRRPTKPAYRWLHLSDIHFGCRGHAEWIQVVDDFERSLDQWLPKIGGPIDLILVTGDLTNRAKPDEFAGITAFLDRILARIQTATGHRPLVVAVPGNHDLTRPSDLLDFAAFDRYVTPGDAQALRLHERLWSDKKPDRLLPLFAEYTRWADTAVLPPLRARADVAVHQSFFPGDLTVILDSPGRFPLTIVGLNSAWLHYQDAEPGALALPAEQFLAALPPRSTAGSSPLDLFKEGRSQRLLMHHHPRTWLSPGHQKIHDGALYVPHRFAACLFGHMHEPTAAREAIAGGDDRCFFQAPSLFGLEHYGTKDESRLFGYAFGMLREDGELRLWPLRSTIAANNQAHFARDTRFHWKNDKYVRLRGARTR